MEYIICAGVSHFSYFAGSIIPVAARTLKILLFLTVIIITIICRYPTWIKHKNRLKHENRKMQDEIEHNLKMNQNFSMQNINQAINDQIAQSVASLFNQSLLRNS